MRRAGGVIGALAITAGVFLVVTALTVGGFRAAAAGEVLLDSTRGELSNTGLRDLRRDFESAKAATAELVDRALPAIADRLDLTDEQLADTLRTRYPAIAKALAERSEITAFTEKAISNLEHHQDDYESADDLPVPFLPLTAGPAITIGFGLVVVGLGVALALRPRRRSFLVALGVVGLLLVAFPLAGRLPQKASDAADLIDSLNITPPAAAETRAKFETSINFTRQVQNELIPDLARALRTTPEQLATEIARDFPTLARTKGDIEDFLRRFAIDLRVREEGTDEFAAIRDVPTRAIPWFSIATGVVLVALAGVGLAMNQRVAPTAS